MLVPWGSASPAASRPIAPLLVGLLGAVLSAAAYVTVRDASRTEHEETIVLWFPLTSVPLAVVGTLVAMVALRRPPVEVGVFAAVVAIVVARHRVNLAQLARGEERTLEAGPAVAPASEANGQRVGREDGDARPRG